MTVIGIGAMGRPIADALLEAGRSVTVWNRSPGRTSELAARGAAVTSTAAQAVQASELVLVTLLDDESVREVLTAVGGSARGATIVVLATMTPTAARDLSVQVDSLGADHLAGVMMAVPAQIGTPEAQVLYAGRAGVWSKHEAALRSFAGDSALLGNDAGLPALYDVGLLSLLYATMTGWLQAFAVVGSGGVAATDFLPYAQRWFDNVVLADDPAEIAAAVDARSYPDTVPSSVALNAAALRLVLKVHEQAGVDASLMRAVSTLADRRLADGHGDDGYTSLAEALRPS